MKKKKKLIWQIFPSFLIITFISLSAVTLYSTNYFKTFFLENAEKELTIRAALLQKNVADVLNRDKYDHNYAYINEQCRDIGKRTGTRVTIILPSGVVVGDSFGDIKTMENHKNRPEIIKALKKEKGLSIRHSATLGLNMMYIALPVMNDNKLTAVVRTSLSVSTIENKIKKVRNNLLFALFFTIIAAAGASLYAAKRITRPIQLMKTGAAEFAKGNLNSKLAIPDTEELSELAIAMNQMAEILDEKITAFKNRSMELEAVHASMQEGVIAIDETEKIITINNAAAKIFNFPASSLKSMNILEIARNIELQQFIEMALATHKPVEADISIKKDKTFILRIHSTALYDIDRIRIGTLIIFHDITRIKLLERMQKDFAANVSHELKTPLTAIKGFVETIRTIQKDKEPAEYDNFLKIIEKNVNRMIELINDLLVLSKLERLQGTDINFKNQNLSSLIHSAVNVCRRAFQKKNISVTIDCDEKISAKIDPVLMEQAVINLVDNAVKYSEKNTLIFIKAVACDDKVMKIEVKDQGRGIGKSHIPKIFNRFYRVDKSRSRNEGGTGLGLAIVKHIVQYHNGKIEVSSIKGKGSVFTITIQA